jgi:hypothetical protein
VEYGIKPKGGSTMTTEELLRPRYKVAIPYPGSIFKVGQIVEKHPYASGKYYIPSLLEDPEKFPEIFKPLHWSDDRMVEDMPQYVRSIQQEYDFGLRVGAVVKVKKWVLLSETLYVVQSPNHEYHPSCLIPATKEEYEAYLQTTNQLNNGQ